MKAYTDLDQSKILSEILPHESADHFHIIGHLHTDGPKYEVIRPRNEVVETDKYWPCWSLAALLNYIKDKCSYFELVYISNTLEGKTYKVETAYRLSSELHDVYEDEPIDACYKMILELNELNLL